MNLQKFLFIFALWGSAVPFAFSQCCDCQYGYCIDNSCSDTPIIIDTTGAGFHLTDAKHGVLFNLSDEGPKQYAWTQDESANAFLVLDRNGNGFIDDGSELFGNRTPQPLTSGRNGFAALAVFDLPDQGGNNDGIIDSQDRIFSKLRLWRDLNHNGLSEANELFTLDQLGIESISLNYVESRRTDEYGNEFRFKAKVRLKNAPESDRWAYDVILTSLHQPAWLPSTGMRGVTNRPLVAAPIWNLGSTTKSGDFHVKTLGTSSR